MSSGALGKESLTIHSGLPENSKLSINGDGAQLHGFGQPNKKRVTELIGQMFRKFMAIFTIGISGITKWTIDGANVGDHRANSAENWQSNWLLSWHTQT